MSERQYVACQFSPLDEKGYTYHNDGDPVAVGDRVKVLTKKGAERTVTVCRLVDETPSFETKPILGRVETAAADRDQPIGPLL